MVHQQTVAIYTRVSTEDQDCERQVSELQSYAERCGYVVAHVFKETASGAKNDRAKRKQVMELARKRHIDAVLVSELSRWGRSTEDLLTTIQELAGWNCSVLPLNGPQLDVKSANGKLMLTVLSAISEFERSLLKERIVSGIAHAKSKGVKFGRPVEVDRTRVLAMIAEGKSVRGIAAELGISPTTVQKLRNA